jgi:hypothetical protein
VKQPLSAAEAAYRLRVCVATVTEMVRTKQLRVLCLGGQNGKKRFFHPDDVERARLDRLAHPPSNAYRGVPRGRGR